MSDSSHPLNSSSSELWLLDSSFNRISISLVTPGPSLASELFLKTLFIFLTTLQCALLHPQFQNSQPARWTRASLGPLTITWWFLYPFRYAATPIELNHSRNLTNAVLAIMLIMKTIELSFVKGPYYMRELKEVRGTLRWEKEPPPDQVQETCSWGELAWWTFVVMISHRGLRFSWAPACNANTLTLQQTLIIAVRLQLTFLLALGFLLYSMTFPSGSPAHALISLGVPSFKGLAVLARCLHSVCYGLFISSMIELMNSVAVVFCHLTYPYALAHRLPPHVSALFNPLHYPPAFNSIFDLRSLAHFWGKSWHFKTRRVFLVCGGKPAEWLASRLGASYKARRIFGLFGIFAASGFYHEFILYVTYQSPHPTPRSLLSTFPGAFFFFIVQPIGILLEPYIIPFIPKPFGGGRFWTTLFLLATVPMFAKDACLPGGYLTSYASLDKWRWFHPLIPAPLITSFQNAP